MQRRLSYLLGFFLLCSGFVYSSGGKDDGEVIRMNAVGLTDSGGTEVALKEYPEKVVSLGPNITETIYALDRGSLLIGRTDYCDYPDIVRNIPSVGTLQEPNIERIIALQPDLVLASTHVSAESIESLRQVGIPVALLYGPEDFSGLEEVIEGCGIFLNAKAEAAALMERINLRKDAVLKKTAERNVHPTVYYALGFGDGGDWTAGAGTFIDSMIGMAGGDNIVTQEGWSYSKEMLVAEDPDIIILGEGNRERFLSLPIYKDLIAAKTGRVYEADENLLVRQGPRLIDGLELLSSLFEGPLDD